MLISIRRSRVTEATHAEQILHHHPRRAAGLAAVAVRDAGQSTVAAPERSLGLAGSILKGRYLVKALSSVRRDVVVYRAEDAHSGRPITLEVLRDELAGDAEFVTAVREQAWTLATSAHAHRGVARVYDCGT